MTPSVPRPPTQPLLLFKNDDLLVTSLAAISACEGFKLEGFLNSSSSENTTRLTTFHLFPKLFPEIRLRIWAQAYANLRPRHIAIEPPLIKVPALLQTCFDSRKIGLGIYTRQEHAARADIPAFVSVIDFEKDCMDLTARGEFDNPQPEVAESNHYMYTNDRTTYFQIYYDDNLLIYTIHHYPELCGRFKRVSIRSCYMAWLGKLAGRTEKLSIVTFFKKNFPALERVGVVSSGVGENPDWVDRWEEDEDWSAEEQWRDSVFYGCLERESSQGRLKYHSAGSWV
ncbi:hypothetical protein BKA65DRAFT_478577 [Rhexocercosporidium sp. MPI-PUGE-AT-0058]|nr:hypothetical protein BKA65DRAFT_478577 [Rhexocercosporidium sp. MPI-PUGE-AT-0058]